MTPLRTPDDVIDLANGFFGPRALLAGARAGVFAVLADDPRTAAEVAERTGMNERAMELLLLALAGMGLLGAETPRPKGAKPDDAAVPPFNVATTRFSLTALARECLVQGAPRDLTAYLKLDADSFESWSRLEEALRSGAPVEVSSRAAREGSPQRHRDFVLGMRSTALGNAPLVADALDLPRRLGRDELHLLDVGGGPGTYAFEFCRRWPSVRATVFDLPETIAIAREVIGVDGAGLPGVAERIDFRAGDFHKDPLGTGYDAVFVSHVVHGHPEATLAPLLSRVASSLAPLGLVAIHDFILDETRTEPPFAALFALNMLVMSDRGRTYSQGELRKLLEGAGLQGVEALGTGERRGISVVIARSPPPPPAPGGS